MSSLVDVTDLLDPLHENLIELLRNLSRDDWEKPTVCPLWSVKDVAAHLLDTAIRRLSLHRDGYIPFGDGSGPLPSEELVPFLNRLNAEWTKSMQRVSPTILIELMDHFGPQQNAFFKSLNPHDRAFWPVVWAGENVSQNWLDIGREYTERWLHQQQIREAVGAGQVLLSRKFFHPLISLFLLGVPHNLTELSRPDNTVIHITITGEAGDTWCLQRKDTTWELEHSNLPPAAQIVLPPEIAWRLFSKAIRPEQALEKVVVMGDVDLANAALKTVSVMA